MQNKGTCDRDSVIESTTFVFCLSPTCGPTAGTQLKKQSQMRNHIGTKPLVSRLLPSSDCACPRACPLQLQMLVTCTCTGHCTCESASGEALTTVTAVSAPADLAISTHVFTWHSRSINAACIRKPQLCIAARCASCVTLRSISCSETSAR